MIIIGDAHAKNQYPHSLAIDNFLRWVKENYATQSIVFLGDLFDSSSPHNTVRFNIMSWMATTPTPIYILTGNHDFSQRMSSALAPLRCIKNVTVIDSPGKMTIENKECYFLPHAHRSIMDGYKDIKDEVDFVFTHITPPESAFGSEGIQLTMKARVAVIHGHQHIQKDFSDRYNKNIILGVFSPTRNLEEKQDHRILEITKDGDMKFVPVPQTFTYETIKFGDKPSNPNNILNIADAPDIKSVYDQYKGCHIRREGITVLATDGDYSEQKFSVGSMGERFMTFAKERAVSQEVLDCFAQYQEA